MGNHSHHFAGLVELLDKSVHLLYRSSATCGDTLSAATVEQFGVAAGRRAGRGRVPCLRHSGRHRSPCCGKVRKIKDVPDVRAAHSVKIVFQRDCCALRAAVSFCTDTDLNGRRVRFGHN